LEQFCKLGGYHDALGEDVDYDHRLIKSGGRIWLADDLVITYVPRNNIISLFYQYVKHGRGQARRFLRHGGRRHIRHFILPSVAPIVILAFFGPLYWPLAVPASLWLLACLSYGLVLGIIKKDVCAAASGYASIVMQLAWSLAHWWEIISIRAPAFFRPSGSAAEAPRVFDRASTDGGLHVSADHHRGGPCRRTDVG
jgi:succinoglycan biosynthesis protein ExoA